jgi:hypothetical protein
MLWAIALTKPPILTALRGRKHQLHRISAAMTFPSRLTLLSNIEREFL